MLMSRKRKKENLALNYRNKLLNEMQYCINMNEQKVAIIETKELRKTNKKCTLMTKAIRE